ncbi:type IV pilus biogenesis protein PilM [Pseudoduganella violacea]|uniref:PilM protein n=1 Tax=Pseudoduganella violacea TaxID=1715466 RepID=A0A7W5BGC5_9BURK|nr:type IV pilus biogenesis protein PilM [Pseudoduganella violacea]MBB3122335.1 hypothetical protein [Pseudoduganella violacea]
MWNIAILTIMMAAAGGYTVLANRQAEVMEQHLTEASAESMANYRTAVVAYFRKYNELSTSVSLSTLRDRHMLRDWAVLDAPPSPPWANYRDTNGTIYIYAQKLPRREITSEIVHLSRNSILAGSYRIGSSNLQSPIYGDTGISLSALIGKGVPDGAPVWLAVSL